MRIALTCIIVTFVLFCGWLVVESGFFENFSQVQRKLILLQNTTDSQANEALNTPEGELLRVEAADSISFGADNAPAKAPVLGSVDPKSGYKFKVESSSKGAAIKEAVFSEFNDRDHKNPKPLVILSPMQQSDGGEVLSMANGDFVFVEQLLFSLSLEFQSDLVDGHVVSKDLRQEFENKGYSLAENTMIKVQEKGKKWLIDKEKYSVNRINDNRLNVYADLKLPLDKLHWKTFDVEIDPNGSQKIRFEAIIKEEGTGEPVVKLAKIYKISRDSYLLDCDITIENLSSLERKVRFNLTGPGGLGREDFRTDMRKVVGGFAISKADKADQAEVVSSKQGISSTGFLRRTLGLKDAVMQYQQALRTGNETQIEEAKEKLRIGHNLPDQYRLADFLWAAAVNKYFAAILVPLPDEGKVYCDWVADKMSRFHNPDGDRKADSGDETIGLDLKIASITLAEAGQAASLKTYKFHLYLGPKDKSLFDKNKLYKKYGFVQTIEFMGCCCPGWIIKPLAFGILWIMKWMYGFIHNYGVVIIILVFLMRLVMHPITKKSQVSMSKMSKLAPKAEEIKKKYANNKAEMNKQMMALYREQGASPVMGFLPMMVQMPIWIALWSAVYASIDLRGAAFLPFWIKDLSIPDALWTFPQVLRIPLLGWRVESLNLLPLLMGVAFYLQQRLMPTQASASTNPQMAQQQKMMKIMLPLMFPLMLYKAPSGVNLYIMASTFAQVFEQHVIRKHIQEKEEAESKGLVAATSKTGGKVKKKKPKPFYKNM